MEKESLYCKGNCEQDRVDKARSKILGKPWRTRLAVATAGRAGPQSAHDLGRTPDDSEHRCRIANNGWPGGPAALCRAAGSGPGHALGSLGRGSSTATPRESDARGHPSIVVATFFANR